MRKKLTGIAAALLFLAAAAGCFLAGEKLTEKLEYKETSGEVKKGCIVLDAGHGGSDSGKIGVNGAEEKVINLSIVKKIKGILEESGYEVVLTRESDDRLGNSQAEDLRKRVSIMDEAKPILAVSIHQNSYHDPAVFGAQVFYHPESEKGKLAAETIQEAFLELNPANTKKAKSNHTYYILKKTAVPVVIAECGFLSNYEEAEKLSDEGYQDKAARAVAAGITTFAEMQK